jgi:ankyrin repeat protein
MADAIFLVSYVQTLVALASLLQKRHQNDPAEIGLLDEGSQLAQEIEELVSHNLPEEPDTKLQVALEDLPSTLREVREGFSTAKSRKDLQQSVLRLRRSRDQLSSALGKEHEGQKVLIAPDVRKSNCSRPVWVQAEGSTRRKLAVALLDTGSRENFVSRHFLDSLKETTSWSAILSPRASRLRVPPRNLFYGWSRNDRAWLGPRTVKLDVSLDESHVQVHSLLFTVHYGVSFFGDMLLGMDFIDLTNSPFRRSSRDQGLISIHTCQQQTKAHVIFVHSLYGDAHGTWQGKSNVFWPRDFLAEDLKYCSISTYSYNISRTLSRSAKSFEKMMDDLANDLLEQIDLHTSEPILWICHSLGGHIVKSALTRSGAKLRHISGKISRISSMTKGAIFLGTPHRVSTSLAVFEDILAVSDDSKGVAERERELKSQKFDNILAYTTSAFASLMDRERFPVLSLFENQPMLTKQGPRRIVLPFTRMNHPDESCDDLDGDHLSICRFETKEEQGYKRILASVKDFRDGKISANTWNSLEMDTQSKNRSIRTSLSDDELVNIDKIYMNLRLKMDLPAARWQSSKSGGGVDSTWIMDDPKLQHWLSNDEKRPLLIFGPVGCGKSKIAESMQDWLEVPERQSVISSPPRRPCRLQLFFKSDQRAQQTPITMLEFLIAQILDQNAGLVYHIKRKPFSRSIPLSLAHSLLQGTLGLLLEDTCWSSIYLVIDALDECNPKHAAAILEILNFMFSIANVRSVITMSGDASQPSGIKSAESIHPLFGPFIAENHCIDINLAETAGWRKAISGYLEDRLLEFRNETGLALEDSKRLKEAILCLKNLSFLVIDLSLQHLRGMLSGGNSRRKDVFEAQLEQLKDRAEIDSLLIDLANIRPRQSHWVLSVLACAFEPLRVPELTTIFLRDEETEWEGVPKDEASASAELQSLVDNDLRQLLRIDGDGLHLASQSVRQVLHDRMARADTIDRDAIKTEGGWHDPQRLHLRLSKICLLILLDGVESNEKANPDSKSVRLPAEGYARRHWQKHLLEACESPPVINRLVLRWIKAQKEWQYGEVEGPSDLSPVLLKRLTENNLSETMGAIFEDVSLGLKLPDAEDMDRVLENSLTTSTPETLNVLRAMMKRRGDNDDTAKTFLAMADGNEKALAELLRLFDEQEKQKYLRKAIEMQKENLVRTILDSYSEDHRVPKANDEIAYAVQYQSQRIVKCMLARKELFDLDSALLEAVDVANFGMAEQLLAHGAKVCLIMTDPPTPTPLHIAAQRGKLDLVDLMLNWNAPVNIRDGNSQTPLHHAAKSGRVDIIHRLVKGSASLVATDNHGCTALFSACAFGQVEAAKLLWSLGASISQRDNSGRLMLHSAARFGHEEVVKMLLSAGISAQCTDNAGVTPIHEACRSGWTPILDTLLQTGASTNIADSKGRTSLHYACQCDHVPESVVQFLLGMGADASARDSYGCTPLMLAAQFSTVRVLKIIWTYDSRLFRDADQGGRTVLDYLDLPGEVKISVNYDEKANFLRRYYLNSQQLGENKNKRPL